MRIEVLLGRLEALDAGAAGEGLVSMASERESLVRELGQLCRHEAAALVRHLPRIEKVRERGEAQEQAVREDRERLMQSMQELQTHLRQLKSFSGLTAADRTLLDRLA